MALVGVMTAPARYSGNPGICDICPPVCDAPVTRLVYTLDTTPSAGTGLFRDPQSAKHPQTARLHMQPFAREPLVPSELSLHDIGTAQTPPVVVACDDIHLGDLLDTLLRDAGYHTVLFATGATLLERLCAADQSCVVLLSLRRPPLTSVAILTAVAANPALSTHHAYILLTARHDMLPANELALLKRLAVPVVPKPFDISVLIAVVSQAAARLNNR